MSTVVNILTLARKKQLMMDSILSVTKEIETMFSENFAEDADRIMDSRMEEIQRAIQCDEEIGKLLDETDLPNALKLEKIMKLDIEGMMLSEDEKNLYDVCADTKSIALTAAEIDKKLSIKLMGKSSIYDQA